MLQTEFAPSYDWWDGFGVDDPVLTKEARRLPAHWTLHFVLSSTLVASSVTKLGPPHIDTTWRKRSSLIASYNKIPADPTRFLLPTSTWGTMLTSAFRGQDSPVL